MPETTTTVNSWPTRQILAAGAGIAAVAIYLCVLTWYMQRTPYRVWGGLVLAPILLALPVPLFLRAARRDPDPRMVRLITVALLLKLLGMAARYIVIFYVYTSGDAISYDREGTRIADAFRSGNFDGDFGNGGAGTRFLQYVTGWVYTFIGPTKVGAFIVFSWFSFIGMYLYYRAFRLAVPRGDSHRYALFVFFLPSLVYWPSSIGKEAWMTLGLGLTAYGVARLYVRQRGAIPFMVVGMWATSGVRPHITLAILVSLVAGYLLRRSETRVAMVTKVIGLALLVAATSLVLSRAEGYFGVEKLNAETATAVLEETQSRSEQGGSEFNARPVSSPIDMPPATVTVLFRPFPFEAHNFQTAIASVEGLTLAVICLWSVPRLRRLPRQLIRTPYAAFALTYTVLYIVAFSNINNFGILARERIQLFPIFLVLLCLPTIESKGGGGQPGAAPVQRPRFHPAGRA